MIFNFTKIPSNTITPVVEPTIPTGAVGFRVNVPEGDQYARRIALPRYSGTTLGCSYSYLGTVYWGDGTNQNFTSYSSVPEKEYATGGIYDIFITGVYQYFFLREAYEGSINPVHLRNKITHWWSFGDVYFKRFSLRDCPNLEYISPNAYFPTNNLQCNYLASTMIGGFANNPSLKNIPYGLFTTETADNSMWEMLKNNTSMRFLPNTLLHTFQPTNCESMCEGMTSLESIPSDFFTGVNNLSNVDKMFYGCSGITGPVPELWLNPQYTNHSETFYGCVNASNYSSIPSSWK